MRKYSLITGLFRVRSPLLAESLLMSFPPGTEMFQFPGFASTAYVFSCRYPIGVGCPIRISTDQRLLAAPRGFSQRATSFTAQGCDEGRGTLRKATGSREQALIRGYPNGATHPYGVSAAEYIGCRGKPGELKHLSTRRKRHQQRFR